MSMKAQDDFAPVGAVWHYHQNAENAEGSFGYLKATVVADSMANNLDCKLIELERFDPFNGFVELGTELLCMDSSKVYWQVGGELWCLYDFAAETGDSWVLSDSKSLVMQVDSTGYQVVNNIELKVLFTSMDGEAEGISFSGQFAEKLGWNQFLFPVFDQQWLGPLRCYQDDQIGFYNTGAAPSCEYDSFEGVTSNAQVEGAKSLQIFPTLASDRLQFTIPELSEQTIVQVLDVNGRVVRTKQFLDQSGRQTLTLRGLPMGSYFLRLYGPDGEPIVEKFIVQ